MHDTIQQKDINNAAWAACDTFRGVVDPAQYKDYIKENNILSYPELDEIVKKILDIAKVQDNQ